MILIIQTIALIGIGKSDIKVQASCNTKVTITTIERDDNAFLRKNILKNK